MLFAGQVRRQVSRDQIVHIEKGNQAIGRSQITADVPFMGASLRMVASP